MTTNDNLRAIRFYQRRGMDLAGLRRDFDIVVRRAKPQLGDAETDRIPFRHALLFEYQAGRQRGGPDD